MPKPRDPARKNIDAVLLPSGLWRYRLRMMVGGVKRIALFATPELAAIAREQWRRGGLPSGDPVLPPPAPMTVEDALALYAMSGTDPHGIRSLIGACRRDYPALLAVPVKALHLDHVATFRRLREEAGRKPNTIRVNLATLRAAIKRQRPDFRLPKRAIPAEDATRQKMMTETQLQQVLLATVEPQRTMVLLAALTFMRQGEIRLLRREAVDLVANVVRLRRAKAGPRTVKLSPAAAQLLREHLAGHQSEWVFPNQRWGRPYSAQECWVRFKRAARAVGLPDWTFHDLRHHCAMVALNAGTSFPVLQAMGGWASPRMVLRYATATDETIRTHLLALDRHATRPRRGRAGA